MDLLRLPVHQLPVVLVEELVAGHHLLHDADGLQRSPRLVVDVVGVEGDGEVDVLFSYFMALNREDAINAGGFNNRALYYRNADMEFSLKLRQSNGRLLQIELPLEQARHHGYYDTDPEYRDLQSKKNYDRILERYRGKNAILSPRR